MMGQVRSLKILKILASFAGDVSPAAGLFELNSHRCRNLLLY